MKLATFLLSGHPGWGIIEDQEAIDVGTVLQNRFPDLKALIAAGAYGPA